ncbi:hypothetical protein ANRL1_02871 [Anaerolineae bacterium]|nr:hypothetical protein ANRL1_02871 [Anaerolineae bacterium]
MKPQDTLPLFVVAGVTDPISPTDARNDIPARERKRTEVMIETLAACITNPTIVWANGPGIVPEDFLRRHRFLIELERMARLHKTLQREDATLDEIRACAMTLTNPEICGVLSVASMGGPPSREVFAEYQRAFAHCFSLDEYLGVFGSDEYAIAININDLEMFDYDVRPHLKHWSRFDADERTWVEQFNKGARTEWLTRKGLM